MSSSLAKTASGAKPSSAATPAPSTASPSYIRLSLLARSERGTASGEPWDSYRRKVRKAWSLSDRPETPPLPDEDGWVLREPVPAPAWGESSTPGIFLGVSGALYDIGDGWPKPWDDRYNRYDFSTEMLETLLVERMAALGVQP